ncbi:MAG: signal peptidase I [Chitinispirillia bacterium]|nr:signal peptidase I [Chitinispirillia bacterium]MCL2269481.1 signal peptidase I [Chitinispirillia bacterium]
MNKWKLFWEKVRGRADVRPIFKMGAWSFFIVLAAGLLIKLFVFDSVRIDGTQMEPAILSGDRILIFKTPYITPIMKRFFNVPEKPVVTGLPDKSARTLLRIAAGPGDTISISEGQFYRNGLPLERFHKDSDIYTVIPAGYSPADFMQQLRLPKPGDSLTFGELSMRDRIFAYSMLRQDRGNAGMNPGVIEDGVLNDNYEITDFALYNGPIDDIPEHMRTDWFFWDRLQEYLTQTSAAKGKKAQLTFSFFRGDKEITGFKVKKRYVFLIGQNWTGAKDSRYFGPIAINNIEGKAMMTLWGFVVDDNGKRQFDKTRVFKLIR